MSEQDTTNIQVTEPTTEVATVPVIENVSSIIAPLFTQLLLKYLSKPLDNINSLSVKINPEMQQYFCKLCLSNTDKLNDIQFTLGKVIADGQINAKDIPLLIHLVKNIYEILKQNKKRPKIDPYDLLKSFLNIAFVIYVETNKIQNTNIVEELLKITDASIELIKLKTFNLKKGLFNLF